MRESKIEKAFVQGCKERGLETIKIMMTNRRGVYDRIVFMPRGRVAFVELKADDGETSVHQENFGKLCTSYGISNAVLYGMEGVDEWFMHYDSIRKTLPRSSTRVTGP